MLLVSGARTSGAMAEFCQKQRVALRTAFCALRWRDVLLLAAIAVFIEGWLAALLYGAGCWRWPAVPH